MSAVETAAGAEVAKSAGLERGIDWTGAFWVASGVPPLVLFSIGAVAATVGKLSWIVWAASIAMGFIQSFTYAEIAGLFPDKAGGTSMYGAIAWVRYGKIIAPDLGLVQLVRLVAGASDGLCSRSRIHSQRPLRAGLGDQYLAVDAARSRIAQDRIEPCASMPLSCSAP